MKRARSQGAQDFSNMQNWEGLLTAIQDFYGMNPHASLQEVRRHADTQPIVANEELEFREAKRIDDSLFGAHENTHWAQAYSFPQENAAVTVFGKPCTAKHVGIFTFTPIECQTEEIALQRWVAVYHLLLKK